jgi:hypothetical protein
MAISRTAPIPPKQGEIPRVEQQYTNLMEQPAAKACPAAEVCKSVNNYYPGTCTDDPTDVARRRCQVSMVLLAAKKK